MEILASLGGIPAELQQSLVNAIIEGMPGRAYLAAKTGEGIVLLRERAPEVRAD